MREDDIHALQINHMLTESENAEKGNGYAMRSRKVTKYD